MKEKRYELEIEVIHCGVLRELEKRELRNRIEEILVIMAEGSHLYPYRTQKLSPPAPMVLHVLFVGE